MEQPAARRVREILAAIRPLAAEYYQLTNKPLGVTGEIAEYVAAELLGLDPDFPDDFDPADSNQLNSDIVSIS